MPSRRRRFRARPKPQPKKPPANAAITAPQVRLIGVENEQLGVVDTKTALEQAREAGLDLVLVAQKTDPPVARLIDLGKHMYERRKADAKQRAHSKGKDVKGVRLGFKTEGNDWEMRLNQAAGFLENGHKVKIEMRLRGRERQRFDQAEDRIKQFVQAVPRPNRQEGPISRAYNNISAIIAPA